MEAFSPDFVESPPASLEFLPEMPLPCFSEDQVSLFWATAKKPDIPALLRQKLSWDLRAAVDEGVRRGYADLAGMFRALGADVCAGRENRA